MGRKKQGVSGRAHVCFLMRDKIISPTLPITENSSTFTVRERRLHALDQLHVHEVEIAISSVAELVPKLVSVILPPARMMG